MRIDPSRLTGLGFLVCLLSFSFSLSAQDYRPGYIIKSNADSVSGFVRYKTAKGEYHCDFKQTKKSSRVSFSPENLLAYGFADGGKYVSMVLPGSDVPKEKVFVRVLSEGPITLYRYGKYFFVEKDEILTLPFPTAQIVDPVEIGAITAQKRWPSNNKMWKQDKRYVGVLNRLLADCQMKADDTPYYEKELTNIVNNYNTCKGIPPRKGEFKPMSRLNVGFLGGYVISDLTIKESAVVPFRATSVSFTPSKTVVGGVSLDLSSPRVNDKLFLTIEGWYFKSVYLGTDYRSTTYEDITIDISSIRMLLGLRYNFLKESSTPFFKLGISGTITQDLELKSIVEREDGVGRVYYDDDLTGTYFEKKVRGFWFSAGYDRLIVGKMKGFLEFRFERADAYFGTPISPDSKLNNFCILAGVRF